MIPILYSKTAAAFENNGIGHLRDAISCEVEEERNGAYELTLKYPIAGVHYAEIAEGSVIKAKAGEAGDLQLFRVYKSSRPINGIVTFSARHISYDLGGHMIRGMEMADTTPGAALNAGFSLSPLPHCFTAWSDISTLNSISVKKPRSLRNLCGGEDGSVLSVWGGEYEFDNFTVKLHRHRGADCGVVIEYGKNLTDVRQERNINDTYTHVYPYAVRMHETYDSTGAILSSVDETVTLPEEVIEIVNPEAIGHTKTLLLDLSEAFGKEEEVSAVGLRGKAEKYISEHDLGKPKVSITFSMLQVWDLPEYTSFSALERVRLCDTVTVRFVNLGIDAKAKIIKTTYDSLAERYKKLEAGDAKSTIADTVKSMEEKISDARESVKTAENRALVNLNNAIAGATQAITGNSGGHIVLYPANHPQEILIMDSDSISTAQKLWRLNLSGFGYSSTGYAGPYGTAITMNGEIVADYITAGTLRAIDITGCTITGGTLNIRDKFTVDADGNAHAEGYIKATSGVIGGCAIADGVLSVPAANITGKLVADQINAANLHVSAANIDGEITAGSILVQDDSSVLLLARNGGAVIAGWNVNSNAFCSGSTLNDSSVFLCSGSSGMMTIAGHSDSDWVIKAGNNFGVNTSGELYCTAGTFSGVINASGGTIGNAYHKWTIGTDGNNAAIYCGTGTLASVGGLGTESNRIYIGTNGISCKCNASDEALFDYTTVIRSGTIVTYGDNNGSGNYNRGVAIQTSGISFYQLGEVKFKDVASVGQYEVAAINLNNSGDYAYLSGTWKSASSISVISDRNRKNTIEPLDTRYRRLLALLTPRRFKYNDGTSGRYHTGFIAQEVKEAMETAGLDHSEFAALCYNNIGDGNELWSLRYEEFVALLVDKIKELETRLAALEG